MAVTKEEWIKNLRQAGVHFETEYETAASEGRWHSAYERRLTALIWRAAALAIQHDFISHKLRSARVEGD